tara:strand:+ start:389 stop:493 length:105 start_codon:yes stop_codon:yes gene_type:complete
MVGFVQLAVVKVEVRKVSLYRMRWGLSFNGVKAT